MGAAGASMERRDRVMAQRRRRDGVGECRTAEKAPERTRSRSVRISRRRSGLVPETSAIDLRRERRWS